MTNPRLGDQLCFALYTANNQIQRAYRPHLARIGLTYTQYLLMMVLWEDGTQRMSGLADQLQLGPNAITPMVDRLVARGLVERRHDSDDRRVICIDATEAGMALAPKAADVQALVVCQTRLSDPALAAMRSDLHALVHSLTCEADRTTID